MQDNRQTLNKREILRGRTTLHKMLREGGRVHGQGVTLFFLSSNERRFGSIVPIRPFGGAVKRNYARRRLKEFFRTNKYLFPENAEVLLRLYKPPENWEDFFEKTKKLLARIKLT